MRTMCINRAFVMRVFLTFLALGFGLKSGAQATPQAKANSSVTSAASGADPIVAYVGKKFVQGPASVKKIALTFDDGPSGKLTPQYMEILKKENVPATFFMLGESVQKNPTMAKRVADEGFEIGCHTTSHKSLPGKSLEVIHQEIIGTADYIEQVTGKRPRVFRPPYGALNKAVLNVCAEGNMALVLWSVDTNDWKARSTSESVHNAITREAHGGAVILMHDVHEKSVKILAQVIEELKAKGYEFVTVSDLIAEAIAHKVEPGAASGAVEINPAATKPASIPLSKSSMR